MIPSCAARSHQTLRRSAPQPLLRVTTQLERYLAKSTGS